MGEGSSKSSEARWHTLHEALVALVEEQRLSARRLGEETGLAADRVEQILRGERPIAEEVTVLLLVALGAAPSPVARRAGESAEEEETDWMNRSLPAGERHRSKLEFLGFRQDGRAGSNALATGISELGIGVEDLEESTGVPGPRVRSILSGAPPTAEELERILTALPKLHRREVARRS